ncbi:MAG: signal peptidase I [Actinobacteria bacterium]|nr:signal peptidase I [Actinomycetota bacterium]
MRNPVDRLTAGLPQSLRVTIDWVVTIAAAIGIVLLVKAYLVNPYRIPSASMEPTLHCTEAVGCEAGRFSDRVLANRLSLRFGDPERGDVVVFTTPPAAEAQCGAGGTFVKRLIVLPGEMWRMENGVVYIDGRRLREPWLEPGRRDADTRAPQRVPDDSFIMLGDNRTQSCDSRSWGAVPRDNLIGTVFAVYWPPTRISLR